MKYDTPSRKTSKKIQQMLERKANQMLLRASQTLEHSTGLALGSRRATGGKFFSAHRLKSQNNILITHFKAEGGKEDSVDEQEIESFFTEFTAMLRLIQSELRLMLGIIPLPHQKSVLSIILRDALELTCHDADVICAHQEIEE